MNRFGNISEESIKENIINSVPINTKNNKSCIWRQFMTFCESRNYVLERGTTVCKISNILLDWAYNMRKINGENYKEYVVKTMWNSTAKMLQEKYFQEFNIKFDPFTDIIFKEARDARNAKRKELQSIPEKRKISSTAVNKAQIIKMAKLWDENEPEGLQKKFFHIASYELAWRGGEAASCMVYYFKEEKAIDGMFTDRIEYNPIFSKTAQGGANKLTDSKWLTKNNEDDTICPVRLFRLLINKRSKNITSERLFLTPNPFWKYKNSKGWYKNVPLGVNLLSKWTKNAANKIGIDIQNNKITNHSNRASTVSSLAKAGVSDQQIIKITGHSNSTSIKPYLQLDCAHHENLITNLRTNNISKSSTVTNEVTNLREENMSNKMIYNNCTFTNCTFK